MNHQAAAPTTKGGNYLSIKDSESLDTYIQNTLSSLYPPFEATAATVLWQLFSIVEKFYHGDGLRCLIDFLVPAKRLLQCIQRETCDNYAGLIFCHEGWPLCIHEKVVVQLASLCKVRLKPGDFYFQIVPVGKQSVSLVLKCLSRHGHGIEELLVPETMYGYIFTTQFLENLNCQWNGSPLQSCLLTTGPAVYRTPWENIVNPTFVPNTEKVIQRYTNKSLLDKLSSSLEAEIMTQTMENNNFHEAPPSNDACATVLEVPFANSCKTQGNDHSGLCDGGRSQAEIPSLELPTENVREHDINSVAHPEECQRIASVVEHVTKEPRKGFDLTSDFLQENASSSPLAKGCVTKSITFGTDMSSSHQKGQESLYFERKRLFRKSYIEALQNPMNLGSSSEESIAEEEPSKHIKDTRHMDDVDVQHESSWSARFSKCVETREAIRFCQHSQASEQLPVYHQISPDEDSRSGSGRSLSLHRTHKNSPSKDYNLGESSDGEFSANSPKIINGHSMKLENLHDFTSTRNKKDEDPEDSKIEFLNYKSNVNAGCHENQLLSADPEDPEHLLPSQLCEVNEELLHSGVISLCGNRDRGGRAVVQVSMRNDVWLHKHSRVTELTQLLLYFYNIPRKEVRALGLLILVDARKRQNLSFLFKALATLQSAVPHSIHCALILTDKESAFRLDKDIQFQCEVLTSLKALHRFIDCTQLTAEYDGTFPYNHNDWICFRRKLEPFVTNCREAIVFLQHSACSLNSTLIPASAQEVKDLMDKHKTMMKLVLEDELLVTVRLEGGTMLARLRKEEFCNTEDYRDAMEVITKLYNQVDEEVHRLVLLSNKRFQQLETLLAMRNFEEGFEEIKTWFENEKEKYLGPLNQEELSYEYVKRKQEEFLVYNEKVVQYSQRGLQLIRENSSLKSDEECQDFDKYLSSLSIQTQKKKAELEKMVKLYEFYEKADKWVVHCNEYLEQLSVEAEYSQATVQSLQSYHQEAMKISSENFHKVNEVLIGLDKRESELQQWNTLFLKCQQTKHRLEEELSKAIQGGTSQDTGQKSNHNLGSKSIQHSCSSLCSRNADNFWDSTPPNAFQHGSLLVGTSSFLSQENIQNTTLCTPHKTVLPQTHTPPLGEFQRTAHISEDLDNISTCYSEPTQTSTTWHRKHPLKKIMKKTQSFELARHESKHYELHHHGYTGVYIRGLEVASNAVAEKRNTHRSNIKSPLTSKKHNLVSPSGIDHTEDQGEKKSWGSSKLNHIMDEMITTEREYVRSLGYIIDSYFPEMERDDLPQYLRGKRNIIFGNLEKLYDFHCQYFLKELEHCIDFPLHVSHCFLRHEEEFGMYALYSKNKPQSDTLLISHGNAFFKNKQQELGDKMNLASYLLKPIQRMSKYALLLKDLIKECSAGQEQELDALCAAEEMVRFQLRHGNDLLAMDAIKGCDVNLKEQGQLRCQDEFIVYCGRKKYLRHVFLFEDLILFSKTKKIDGGYDIYMYKQSFKTAEIGMTENVGDSGLRFEIWFRRRRKSQDTYILQANSTEIKSVWTDIIGKILWRQALRNRELRMQEMVSMGIGNKPFMDIKPSDAAISDRAIDFIMKGAESRTRASIAVSSFDHSTPFKRPHSTISNSSTSSSSSQSSSSILGSLNLHVYSTPSPFALVGPPINHWSYDVRTCIEEDELEQEVGSQPSVESSESSQDTSRESTSSFSSSVLSEFSPVLTKTFRDEGSKLSSECRSPSLSEKNPRSKPSGEYILAGNI
ncbi:pleckstrin homology domain-containing family G member 4B isoform X3 [Sceloporus undulatus]|uniref:pleckstrin homology domain-containing family G member 4B isoform X3 n=1 Tax=Sceloporus undulatus TaxID=8520 RepID=UPI001C4D286A|nr:pleckstrin homology domain-containing family G member 4B isoform X3 [Sceloporus undulatus]